MCLYCSNYLTTEVAGPPFDEFLNLIGERVNLKGFEGYRAQLDNRSKCNLVVEVVASSCGSSSRSSSGSSSSRSSRSSSGGSGSGSGSSSSSSSS